MEAFDRTQTAKTSEGISADDPRALTSIKTSMHTGAFILATEDECVDVHIMHCRFILY